MSSQRTDLPELVGELARTTAQLRDELDAERRGPPRPSDLVRFTSEITIPAIVLLLETNVRALRLLQRTLRFAQDRDESPETSASNTRQRAEALGRETMGRLDSALADLQDALSGRPPDDEARELLDDVRDLRAEVESRLEPTESEASPSPENEEPYSVDPTTEGDATGDGEEVPVDVDAELQSIKDDVDNGKE